MRTQVYVTPMWEEVGVRAAKVNLMERNLVIGTCKCLPTGLEILAPSEEAQPTLGPWTGLEPTRLETPRTPNACMVPLYHGGPMYVLVSSSSSQHIMMKEWL
ncbi:hypothetical protein E2C01_029324 [Portunus trituberculatus]|uniref:Uncharacterized protein n=1 Tax=Portunus trituberculatus TaxID=210409 RepID=A0A5B7ERK7_PORTR|nr:hypothetical protein [Portunus trituberculatus]